MYYETITYGAGLVATMSQPWKALQKTECTTKLTGGEFRTSRSNAKVQMTAPESNWNGEKFTRIGVGLNAAQIAPYMFAKDVQELIDFLTEVKKELSTK